MKRIIEDYKGFIIVDNDTTFEVLHTTIKVADLSTIKQRIDNMLTFCKKDKVIATYKGVNISVTQHMFECVEISKDNTQYRYGFAFGITGAMGIIYLSIDEVSDTIERIASDYDGFYKNNQRELYNLVKSQIS